MEKLVPLLAGVLQIEPDVLTEKAKTDEGVTEISNSIKELKIFKTIADYNTELNAHVKRVKPIIAQDVYPDHQRDILGALESRIKGDDPDLMALTHKKDYNNTEELISKIIDHRIQKRGGKKEEWETEKTTMQGTIRELSEKVKSAQTEALKGYKQKLNDKTLGFAIKQYEPRINVEKDKVQGQLNYLKYLHDQTGVTVDEDENGNEILRDAKGGILKNEDYTHKTLEQHLEELAVKNLNLHKVVPAGGRGDNPDTPGNNGGTDMSLYNTWDDFRQTERGKTLVTGSKEANDLYGKWLEAHPNKK